MRIGVVLPEPKGGVLSDLAASFRTAAEDGLASAWITDSVFGLDALTAIAVAGVAGPGIEVGSAVTPTYFRHPVTLARQAITTDIAVGGALALGVGASDMRVIHDMLGQPFDKPATYMDEYLSVLLPLLRHGAVTFNGDLLSSNVEVTVRPVGPVPVLLAALGPRMLRLAGTVADGVMVWMTAPKALTGHVVPRVTEAAATAGRPPVRIVCLAPVCVTNDPESARERAARIFALHGQLPAYRKMLDRQGFDGPGAVAVVGGPDDVAAQIEQYRRAGVTDFIASEFGRAEDRHLTRALLRELAAAGLQRSDR
jgi:F420-dependent oxidoreductase-like protein